MLVSCSAFNILDTFSRIINLIQIGLHRDYGLMFITKSNGPKTSKIQKKIISAFRFRGLKIKISSYLKIVNFLSEIFNLEDNTFKPYCKNNYKPIYINVNSNQPKSIIKQIPCAVNLRFNRLLSNKKDLMKIKEFIMKLRIITDSNISKNTWM